jgi:hypothetical protein
VTARTPRKPRRIKRGLELKVLKSWLRSTDYTEQELRALLTKGK